MSEDKREGIDPEFAAIFCGIVCLLATSGFLAALLVDGTAYYQKAMASFGWVKTPCVIRRVRVERRPRSGEPEYRMAISFSYTFEGKERKSGRYDWSDEAPAIFAGESEASLGRIARRYTEGAESYCYVNPKASHEAVLKRGFRWPPPIILYPLTLIGLSLLGFIVSRRRMRRDKDAVES